MKTAKEIINSIPISGKTKITNEWLWTEEKILKAMEEYADQFRQPIVSGQLPSIINLDEPSSLEDFDKKLKKDY